MKLSLVLLGLLLAASAQHAMADPTGKLAKLLRKKNSPGCGKCPGGEPCSVGQQCEDGCAFGNGRGSAQDYECVRCGGYGQQCCAGQKKCNKGLQAFPDLGTFGICSQGNSNYKLIKNTRRIKTGRKKVAAAKAAAPEPEQGIKKLDMGDVIATEAPVVETAAAAAEDEIIEVPVDQSAGAIYRQCRDLTLGEWEAGAPECNEGGICDPSTKMCIPVS